jgi:DNA-binding MarR family transcriptional regulator
MAISTKKQNRRDHTRYADREYLRALMAIEAAKRDDAPVTLEEIRARMKVLPSSASRALGKMVERGLVERVFAPGLFRITDAGREAIK